MPTLALTTTRASRETRHLETFMLKRYAIFLSCVALFLGAASPSISSLGGDFSDPATRHGLFYAWFYLVPTTADQWFWPEGDALVVALAVVVFTLQYLALFGLVLALWRLAIFTKDFFSPYRHRAGLVRRT
jgi:hypothetical protein